jgi:hypothetical protein
LAFPYPGRSILIFLFYAGVLSLGFVHWYIPFIILLLIPLAGILRLYVAPPGYGSGSSRYAVEPVEDEVDDKIVDLAVPKRRVAMKVSLDGQAPRRQGDRHPKPKRKRLK